MGPDGIWGIIGLTAETSPDGPGLPALGGLYGGDLRQTRRRFYRGFHPECGGTPPWFLAQIPVREPDGLQNTFRYANGSRSISVSTKMSTRG